MTRLLPFLAALLWLLAACPGHAQPQPYHFGLPAEKLDVPASPWRVTRVLDLRPDRSRLGAVHRGLDNLTTSADFNQPLAVELGRFFQAQQPVRPDARPVVMRVLTLAISEDMRASSEHSEAELVADFLEPQPDSSYRVLLRVGETTRRGGLDVTKQHPINIALVLQQALRQLAAVPAPAPATETLSPADALAGRGGAMSQRFAIQSAPEMKPGFYRSLQEFRDNAPSEADFAFVVSHIEHPGKRWAGSDEIEVNYLYLDAQHPARPVSTSGLWGLSDGKELLMVHRNRFYKLLPAADGRSYTFTGPPIYTPAKLSDVVGGAVVGGALGGAIAGAAGASGQMVPYELHLASGAVVPVQQATQTDADGFATAPDSAIVYLYRRSDAAAGQPLTVQLAGKTIATLAPGQYLRLAWANRQRELAFCVQLPGTTATCRSSVPDFTAATYLECRVPAAGQPVVFKPTSVKDGQWQVKRLKPAPDSAQ